jgi:hypothetical protein
MTRSKSKGLLQFIIVILSTMVLARASQAGILNGHVDAFSGVTGTVPFDNFVGLSGTIDYAVFTAGDFNANFLGLGYVPGDALVYTYQVFVTGPLGVSGETVGIGFPANTIGTFNIGGVNASSANLTPNAEWLFTPEISTGSSSYGLAYSSPNLPIPGGSLTIDGGTTAFVFGLPTPGPIPEPTTLVIFTTGLVGCWLSRRIRL